MPTNDTFGLASFLLPVQLVTRIGKQAYNGLLHTYSNFTSNSTLGGAFADDNKPGLASSRSTFRLVWSDHGFMISRWALANMLMPFLLYRIHTLNISRTRLRRWRRGYRATVWDFIIPIDTTSPRTRLFCRLPSLFLLLRSMILLLVILLQTSGVFPSRSGVLSTLGDWAAEKEFPDVCWLVFKSVCFAMIVGGFFSSLEGNPSGGEVSFNLLQYSLLLYHTSTLYYKPHDGPLPSRPDKHAVVAIIIPLLLVTQLHLLPIHKRWSSKRLIPSTICAFLYQFHFLYVLYHRIPVYPVSTAAGAIIEVLAFSTVVVTVSLRALSQLLLEGRVTSSVFGNESSLPSLDDDYGAAMLKLASASMSDFVGSSGLLKELAPLSENSVKPTIEIDEWGARVRGPPAERGGFNREFKTIEVAHGRPGASIYNWRELRDASIAVIRAFIVVLRMLRRRRGTQEDERPAGDVVVRMPDPDDDVYERFLAGEVSDDEEGPDYVPGPVDDGDEDSELEESEDAPGEESGLYGDLLQTTTALAAPSSSMAPVLLAHLTSPNAVTRRRYRQLVPTSPHEAMDVAWLDVLQSRRARPRDDAAPDNALTCVVCLAEPRTIVCWPCRCLALCDGCRSSIASHRMMSEHPCPCCRQKVEGFSRIFIP